ncbi:endolytic transglycosylase MltG [Ciceribacter sp. RN22]|uniref:endolytic transglycosylase MltG n=1 Tax=Ciceribacter sp. RN22 TaxID=2954932 RepID=UPI0020926C28|nr:endolytic transglycosylase MltG [Ciceribacter sp. RN22]MCO6177753.1 endolytic transglycosylase MltG [Ciceribacter sp. RN22]
MNEIDQNSGNEIGRGAETASKGPIIPKSPAEALKPERVPAPPRRSRKARSQLVIFLNFLMSLTVMVFVIAVAGFYYVMSAYQEPGPLRANVNFVVRSGAGLSEIANNLERSGAVTDSRIFRYVTATYLDDNETLKAGEYEIKANASMKEIMDLLKSGRSILYSISFPEGLSVKQMFKRLADDQVLEGELPAELPVEGALRPDTYKFSRGTKRDEIIRQMIAAQEKIVDQVWEKRAPDLPLKSKLELVTLASIVEKETGKPDERAHVASVFYNRLQKGMRLQSDPTIVYGLFGGDGKPADRPIFQSDLKKETPYNTYIVKGLPPGPIANPGREALEAVANPWRTEDLYFVADGTGGHVFAATLEEHNANVKKWRKIEAERGVEPDVVMDAPPTNN